MVQQFPKYSYLVTIAALSFVLSLDEFARHSYPYAAYFSFLGFFLSVMLSLPIMCLLAYVKGRRTHSKSYEYLLKMKGATTIDWAEISRLDYAGDFSFWQEDSKKMKRFSFSSWSQDRPLKELIRSKSNLIPPRIRKTSRNPMVPGIVMFWLSIVLVAIPPIGPTVQTAIRIGVGTTLFIMGLSFVVSSLSFYRPKVPKFDDSTPTSRTQQWIEQKALEEYKVEAEYVAGLEMDFKEKESDIDRNQ